MVVVCEFNLLFFLYLVISSSRPTGESSYHQEAVHNDNNRRLSSVFTANFNEYYNRLCLIDIKNWVGLSTHNKNEYVVYEIESKEFDPSRRSGHLHTYVVLELNIDEYKEFVTKVYDSLRSY